MINIISPDQQSELRAARTNVVLARYSVMVILLTIVIGMVYGAGFWLVAQDEKAVNEKLRAQADQSKTYDAVEKEADSFRKNLTIAKSILSKETSYSTFLTTLAKDLPSGAILTQISLGNAATPTPQAGMTLDTRVISYAKVLELKGRLEQSDLFENVNIVNATRPDNIGALTGIEAKYPFEASFNVKLSTQQSKVTSP